jgi:D-inositol-3-phosphate glycosyltransferase
VLQSTAANAFREGGLRVALVSEHASPLATIGDVDAGGQNVHVAELAAGLARLGHEVVVYTRHDDPDLPATVATAAGYDVVHVSAGPARRLPKDDLWPYMGAFADALTDLFRLRRPDVAHAHFWMSAWATRRAARILQIPFLITFHALGVVKRRHQGAADTSPPDRLSVEPALARTADGIVATCSDEVQELTALGVDPRRISIVPCGVDLDRFSPDSDSEDPTFARPPGAPFRVVAVGRLVRRKGFGATIEAVAQLPGVELLIAGGPEGHRMDLDPEANRLLALVKRLGVADRVQLLGPVPRAGMPPLLRSADIVVCAPWYEPFGIVPLEANACGVPVVAAAVGGMLDTVLDGVTGLHVPPRNPAALAEAIERLRADPERRRVYGQHALARVRERFSWSQVAESTAAIYHEQAHGATSRVSGTAASPIAQG